MFLEIIKFLIYSFLIVIIAKYVLVKLLRKLAENLNLKPKTVGNIAGFATSVPELLTISFSSATGFISTSIFNVLSSNIINFIQYIFSIYINKNAKVLKNTAIRIDIIMVLFTILIPVFLVWSNIETSIGIIPIFILLFLLCYMINNNTHKLYLKKQETKIEEEIIEEEKWIKGKRKITVAYSVYLILTGILLFIIGNLLSNTLENLATLFNIPQSILGVVLGIITSIPELITFIESQKHYRNKNKTNSELGVVEATNNLLTSNILNLFFIQSIGIFIYWIVT